MNSMAGATRMPWDPEVGERRAHAAPRTAPQDRRRRTAR
jgi:hypothetical protein